MFPIVVADIPYWALVAKRTGTTDSTTVQDERVGNPGPDVARKDFAELRFDDFRIVGLCEADAVGHSKDVTIDGEAGNAKGMAQHDVGGLAPHSG